jgi:hypothetical protein
MKDLSEASFDCSTEDLYTVELPCTCIYLRIAEAALRAPGRTFAHHTIPILSDGGAWL